MAPVGAIGTVMLTLWLVVNPAWRHAAFSRVHIRFLTILGVRLRCPAPP
jgi:hypothetical protein